MVAISLLGKKIGMTQIFNIDGDVIPVTILQLGPCLITQIKNDKFNQYCSIQIGYSEVNQNKITKAELGHLTKNHLPALKYLFEYRTVNNHGLKIGETITTKNLKVGELINVSSRTIGKGFSGYQKRHNFTRGPLSHGSKNHRLPGSIGAGTTPGRVFPGKKMSGRMGMKKVTVKNLEIIKIINDSNIVLIKGCIPGKSGNIISINTK